MTQLAIIIGYLVLLLACGLLANRISRGTARDYMLASHSIGPVLLLLSLFGTTMTAFALVGSTGKSFQLGVGVYALMASSSGIIHSLCFFLVGIKLWSLGRQHGYTTQTQYFRDRLESRAFGFLLFPILVALVIPYLLIGILGGGAVIEGVTLGIFPDTPDEGLPAWIGSLMICSVVLAYVFLGGMRGTAWANAFQTTVFMVLGVITFLVIARQLGGGQGLWDSLKAATGAVQQAHPEKLIMAPPVFTSPYFLSFLLIPLSAAMFPHLFQHWLTARSAASFKLPIIAHPIFITIVWVPCVLVGAWATSAVFHGEPLIPADIKNVNTVLPIMVAKLSGPILSGLLAAGILAAVMSSLDSQFLCLGTMFTNDIVLEIKGREHYSDRQVVMLARCFIVAIVAVTYLLSLLKPPGIFDLGLWCFSGFTGLVPLVFAALYWKRTTLAGATASVLAAAASWIYFFCQAGYPPSPKYRAFGMLPVATIFLLSAIVLVVVSLLTRPPSKETLARFFPIGEGQKDSD